MIITNNPQNQTKIDQKNDKKELNTKTIFKKDVIANSQISELDLKIDGFINKLLNDLQASRDGSYKSLVLNQAKATQVAPNLVKDIKELVSSLKQEPTLSKFAFKLEKFLKPIEQIKNTNIDQAIKDSGVMLEAKINESLKPELLPTSIKELLSLMKNISDKELSINFLNLAKNENKEVSKSFADLKEILKNSLEKNLNIINQSNFKELLNLHSKLENSAKFFDKISNQKNSPSTIKILSMLNSVENMIKNVNLEISKINFELPNLKKIKIVKNEVLKTINDIKNEIQTLRNSIQTASKQSNLNTLEPQAILNVKNIAETQFSNIISTDNGTLNVQDKLNLAAKRLLNIVNSLDQNSVLAKNMIIEVKHLLKAATKATKDISSITQNNEENINKNIQNDVKATLLKLSDATTNKPELSTINQNANRLITQIQMHQIASFAQNSIQTYLPYTWDDVQSSSVAFKRGKKNKFYAKIELNFIKLGSVLVMLGLFDNKYIDISIATGNENFKSLIQKSSKELKVAITDLGLIVSGFSISCENKFKPYDDKKAYELGFNIKA